MLYDVLVQGAGAAPQIAAAIDQLARHGRRLGIDAVILTRGGGSMEDLWAFNERIVADAIFRCPLPIVAAIGHETDTTIAELVADLRCATPTQAAMTLIPDQWAITEQVDQLSYRLRLLATRQVRELRQRLDAAARHPLFRRPMQMYEPWRQRLTTLTARLSTVLPRAARQGRESLNAAALRLSTTLPRAVRQADEHLSQFVGSLRAALPRVVAQRRQQLEALAGRLEAVNPSNVLERGYSYTLGPDGHVLKSAKAAQPGEVLTTVLSDGRVKSRVEGQGATAVPMAKRTTKKRDDGATLF
jgi:exodeoxyribonuclease VII large subunit